MPRKARVVRETRETKIIVDIVLEPGDAKVSTGIGFFDHMLETLLRYMGASGSVEAVDKRGFDDHHVVEDTALALGEAIARAIGSAGIKRFGYAIVPMDEVLVLAAVDVSGRPGAYVELPFTREEIGGLALENIPHFVSSLASAMRATIHVRAIAMGNNHHLAEAAFKALGMALREALAPSAETISTKGEVRLDVS
jgi:imidazoleglycerol phosphate dehydratase HisB